MTEDYATADERVAALLRYLEGVPARHHRIHQADRCEEARDAAHDPGFKQIWENKARQLRGPQRQKKG